MVSHAVPSRWWLELEQGETEAGQGWSDRALFLSPNRLLSPPLPLAPLLCSVSGPVRLVCLRGLIWASLQHVASGQLQPPRMSHASVRAEAALPCSELAWEVTQASLGPCWLSSHKSPPKPTQFHWERHKPCPYESHCMKSVWGGDIPRPTLEEAVRPHEAPCGHSCRSYCAPKVFFFWAHSLWSECISFSVDLFFLCVCF